MNVLAVIPARGGSKGIPRKNIRMLGGKPLLQYTVEAAFGAERVTRVILSTDDEEIAWVGRRLGVEAPFLRPPELARDDTPTLPVIQHAVRVLERDGADFDAVCILQPTHPFRRAEDVDGCIELLESSGSDSVVTVLPVPAEHHPHWVYFEGAGGTLRLSTGGREPVARRQDLPAAWHREGSVYVVRRNVLMEGNSLYGDRLVGYPMSGRKLVNLDTWEDWRRAEALLKEEALAEGISNGVLSEAAARR
jgi:CMP-N,N'-diacetyllegionaminic acid synthase